MCTPCEEKRKAMREEMEKRQQINQAVKIEKMLEKQSNVEIVAGCNSGNPRALCQNCNALCKYCVCK